MPKSILLIGGPSTGKTTLINHLKTLGYPCLEEISRDVIKKAQSKGIDQLFLEKPLLFSQLLKDARIQQFQEVATYDTQYVFLDRGIPDTVAYMDYIGQTYTEAFINDCKKYQYDVVFILPLWKEIHQTDAERYESFEQAQKIQEHLLATYKHYGYAPIEVPTGDIDSRASFIINTLKG
jgi:predicted ATPase